MSVLDRDPSTAGTVVAQDKQSSSETSGRGLLIVATLADRWGVDADDRTKTVWFELPVALVASRGPQR